MAYGVKVDTTEGFVSLASFNSARVVDVVEVRSTSGSSSVSGWSESAGEFVVVMNEYAALLPNVSWNESNNTVSWSRFGGFQSSAFCDNFDIFFIRKT